MDDEDIESGGIRMKISCTGVGCWASIEGYGSLEELVKAWNRRVIAKERR
jgi:hypothetical protein